MVEALHSQDMRSLGYKKVAILGNFGRRWQDQRQLRRKLHSGLGTKPVQVSFDTGFLGDLSARCIAFFRSRPRKKDGRFLGLVLIAPTQELNTGLGSRIVAYYIVHLWNVLYFST
jgi:hypothetical protein